MKTQSILGALIVASMVGCGGPSKPKNPTDVKKTGEQPIVAPKPKRQVSADAKKDFAKAIADYQAAKKTGINDANCAGLASSFADVYADHPKVVEAKYNEGVVWQDCGKTDKAEQVYKTILQNHPQHGPTLNNLGQILHAKGQSGAALSYFQKAAAAKNSEGYVNLALIQRGQALNGDTNALREAVNNIHRALAVDSFNIEAYYLLAALLYDHARSQSQLEMARLICVQATKVDEKYAPIYNVLGLILLKMERVTPALAEFRRAVDYNPNFVEALMNIGAITLSFRDYGSAEAAFTKVLGLTTPKEVKYAATVGLGVALRGQRKYDQAMAKYQEAEKLDPGNADIAYNMALLVQDYTFDASDPAKGIDTLQKASQLLNRYMSGAKDRSQMGDAKRRMKNIEEMTPMLREQLKMMQQMKGNKG